MPLKPIQRYPQPAAVEIDRGPADLLDEYGGQALGPRDSCPTPSAPW